MSNSDVSLEAVQKSFDGVSASAFTKVCYARFFGSCLFSNEITVQAVASLLKSKPTYVAVGDTNALPYADEIGI